MLGKFSLTRKGWLFGAVIVSFGSGFLGKPLFAADLGLREKVLKVADELLEEAQVSYVYGGSKLGDGKACESCNICLEKKSPRPAQRLGACPSCRECSLDCSHFTELVFAKAGAPYPYLATEGMRELMPRTLRERYDLLDLGRDLDLALPGDLLVYDGHVVILERVHQRHKASDHLRGDVVHATGGRDIKLPGQGIQRERYVELGYMRGPLRRILRHRALGEGDAATAGDNSKVGPFVVRGAVESRPSTFDNRAPESPALPDRLRPVLKRHPVED